MKPIRASDIGSYLYCRRAWWYRMHGQESSNVFELSAGTELHRKHGQAVLRASLFNLLGWIVLLIAIVLLVYAGMSILLEGLA
jgi:CRISPR/Cas system-associated exonuclease Cas4 (RecB family)